jgi:hypothetical protein
MITVTREAGPRRPTSTPLWATQILLAAFFLRRAGSKLTGSPGAVQESPRSEQASGCATWSESSNWSGRSAW